MNLKREAAHFGTTLVTVQAVGSLMVVHHLDAAGIVIKEIALMQTSRPWEVRLDPGDSLKVVKGRARFSYILDEGRTMRKRQEGEPSA